MDKAKRDGVREVDREIVKQQTHNKRRAQPSSRARLLRIAGMAVDVLAGIRADVAALDAELDRLEREQNAILAALSIAEKGR